MSSQGKGNEKGDISLFPILFRDREVEPENPIIEGFDPVLQLI